MEGSGKANECGRSFGGSAGEARTDVFQLSDQGRKTKGHRTQDLILSP